MPTGKQRAANRLNAQKCTGPRTPEGKAISSQNALKTGVDAQSEVIRYESRAGYEELIAEFYQRFQPTVPEERGLVDMLIKSEWLSRRYASAEASVWECGFHNPITQTLSRVLEKAGASFDRVARRINAAQRNYQWALKQLLDLRDRRAKESAPPVPDTPAVATAPAADPAPAVASKPLTPELVSLLRFSELAQTAPSEAPAYTDPPVETPKNGGHEPPIAA